MEEARLLDHKSLKAFSQLTPYRGLFDLIFNWCVIAACITVSILYFHPLLYVCVVILIGARQHALLVVAHDAAHSRLMKSKKMNDFFATYFCGAPLLFDFKGFKSTHLLHHRHLMKDSDPDWQAQKHEYEYHFPKKTSQLFIIFLRDISGLGTYRFLKIIFHYSKEDEKKNKSEPFDLRSLITPAFFLSILLICFFCGVLFEFFIYWIVPSFTWLKWVTYLRALGEHHGLTYDINDEQTKSRTTLVGWFGKTFVAPHKINYHIEHHLYPSIPSYKLKKLHQELMKKEQYRDTATLSHGYMSVIKTCLAIK